MYTILDDTGMHFKLMILTNIKWENICSEFETEINKHSPLQRYQIPNIA